MGKVTLIQKYSQTWKSIGDLIEQYEEVTPKHVTADISDEFLKTFLNIKSDDRDEIVPFVMRFNMENEDKGLEFCEGYTSQYYPKVETPDGNVWKTQYKLDQCQVS